MATDSDGMTELWPFMSRIYASPGVASACLRLQETYGLDIPLLLAVLYGAVSDRALDAVAVQALDASCAEWRKTVVRPLRRIRTAMKSGDVMAWSARVPALREAIKAQELMAERIEVEVLEALIRSLPPASQLGGERTLEDAARLVLDLQAPDRADMLPEDARHICKVLSRLVADHALPRRMKP
ncbi:TIGR02444 family protein [Paracoccus methylovorus]|uniref:TIGR02444 family protein n=1 Tax=Paracoccus methylovorus TaxID=2812658 RepID=A0ABX7JN63_9RHOB|nr:MULTISPECIES: TIGR02444 family protein [Paracoccus]QRZ15104.1 TIGR02444 family protein [Paracoccus methylovorus]